MTRGFQYDDPATATAAALNLYGQRTQPEETPQFLSKSQAELSQELDKLPQEKKAGWLSAKENCPDLVGEDHTLMFLRCEVFDIEMAALRIGKYWNRRIELFGENRAYRPLRIGGIDAVSSAQNSDDSSAQNKVDGDMYKYILKGLTLGYIHPTETHDTGGRGILFVDPTRLTGYNRNSDDERLGMARALWYVLHHVIEGNDSVQKLGMIAIAYPHHLKRTMIDRKLMKMNMESVNGCIPIRMGGFHVCHPPWFFGKILFPIMKMVMPARMQKRVRVYSGSEEKVLENLKEFGLGTEVLPSEIGGCVIMDRDAWIQKMKSRGL